MPSSYDPITDREALKPIVQNLWALGRTRAEIARTISSQRLVDLDLLSKTLDEYEFHPLPGSSFEPEPEGHYSFKGLALALIDSLVEPRAASNLK